MEKAVSLITRIMGILSAMCFIIVFLLVLILTVLRYGFGSSIFGGNEIIMLLFVYSIGLGVLILFDKREHIRVTYFTQLLPLPYRKFIYMIDYVMILIFSAVALYYALEWNSVTKISKTVMLKIPYGIQQFAVILLFFMQIFYAFVGIIRVYRDDNFFIEEKQENIRGEVSGIIEVPESSSLHKDKNS